MPRFSNQKTLFGDANLGAKATFAGGAGGATFWSDPFDISRHDGGTMWLTVVAQNGGASCSIDVFTYGVGDPTKTDPAPANDGRAYGYTSMFSSPVGLTAGGETLYSSSISPVTRRQARWARAKLVVAAGITISVFAQLDVREEI